MCATYLPSRRDELEQHFGVAAPDSEFKAEAYPGYMAPMIRLPSADATRGDRSCALGMFGMVPHWAEPKLARSTYNARTETVATKPSYRNAWKRRQFCIVPAESIFEPCYESGKPVRWEISAADCAPLAITGIWGHKQDGPGSEGRGYGDAAGVGG